jgi:F-type H+-transporting ATPase subunit delta
LDLARENDAVGAMSDDFQTLIATITHSRDLRHFLVSPIIDDSKKDKVLAEIFGGKVNDLTLRFLRLLAKKGRSNEIPAIANALELLLDTANGTVAAVVETASPLGDSERSAIEERLRKMSGRDVRATYVVDPEIIGGFRARFEDQMVDASVRHQLERLHESLLATSSN